MGRHTDLAAKRTGATRAMIEKRIVDGGSWCWIGLVDEMV